jgi:hypothetical protein
LSLHLQLHPPTSIGQNQSADTKFNMLP